MITMSTTARIAAVLVAATVGSLTVTTEAAARGACPERFTVRYGDTLSKIAGYCGTTVGALLAANPQITHASLIYAGEVIHVPAGGYARAPRRHQRVVETVPQTVYVEPRVVIEPAPVVVAPPPVVVAPRPLYVGPRYIGPRYARPYKRFYGPRYRHRAYRPYRGRYARRW